MTKKRGHNSTTLTFNRRLLIASASVTREKNTIHSFADVDITLPRRMISDYRNKTGNKISFTAYIVTCLAKVIKDHPRLNAFISGRKLVTLEDVTVSVLVEREINGEIIPEPVGIHTAQSKTFWQIQDEIRQTKTDTVSPLGQQAGMGWIHYIPTFLLKLFIRIADRSIRMAKKYGKISVTAMGMFSKEPLWFIPHGSGTVLVTVGSIDRREVSENGRNQSREFLCLTVSFDHDIVDGAPAARFMSQFIETLKSGEILRAALDKTS